MEIALAAIQNSEYEHNHRPSNIQTHTMNSSLHKSQQGDLKKSHNKGYKKLHKMADSWLWHQDKSLPYFG
jgi:hypothetical protein